jgi:hypothetical protein
MIFFFLKDTNDQGLWLLGFKTFGIVQLAISKF